VVLHVYPVERDRPAHVTLSLARDGEAGIDASTSLYAETPPPVIHGRAPQVIIELSGVPVREDWVEPREIRSVVRLHEPQLRRCYDLALVRDHALAGTAELHFVIGADGTVQSAAVDGSLPSADALTCITLEATTWRFREGDGPVEVNYPLTFQPPDC
jgi:hypothetical protein